MTLKEQELHRALGAAYADITSLRATIEDLRADKIYHHNCVNRLALFLGAGGERSDVVIAKAIRKITLLRNRVRKLGGKAS